jgi:hypothetical protein
VHAAHSPVLAFALPPSYLYSHTNSYMEGQPQAQAQQGGKGEDGADGRRVAPGSGIGIQLHSGPNSASSPRTLAAVMGAPGGGPGAASPRAGLGGKTQRGSLLAEAARSGTGHGFVV